MFGGIVSGVIGGKMTPGCKEYDVRVDLVDLRALFNDDTRQDKSIPSVKAVKAC